MHNPARNQTEAARRQAETVKLEAEARKLEAEAAKLEAEAHHFDAETALAWEESAAIRWRVLVEYLKWVALAATAFVAILKFVDGGQLP